MCIRDSLELVHEVKSLALALRVKSLALKAKSLLTTLVPETRVFQAADGEDLVILACTVFN